MEHDSDWAFIAEDGQGYGHRNFEDLHVFARARELTNGVYKITRGSAFSKDMALVSQMRRAAVSVMSNIAEGFERGSNKEFVQFLFVAKGSCGEVRAQLIVAFDQEYIDKPTHEKLTAQCRLVSSMLSNLISRLQDSSFCGRKRKKEAS